MSIKDKHSWVAGNGKQDKGTRDISSYLASMKHKELFIQINFQQGLKNPSTTGRAKHIRQI
jgi:hypothetical protein